MASSFLPLYLEVDPRGNLGTIHADHNPVFDFVLSERSAFKAALKYKKTLEVEPAPGVEALAGRFVFDLWGGRYGRAAEEIEKAGTTR